MKKSNSRLRKIVICLLSLTMIVVLTLPLMARDATLTDDKPDKPNTANMDIERVLVDGSTSTIVWEPITIYREDHVFGTNCFLDKIFSTGQASVEIFSITEEYKREGFVPSKGCSLGNHRDVVQVGFPSLDWTCSQRPHPTNCMLTAVTRWKCVASGCGTEGYDIQSAIGWHNGRQK